MVLQFVVESKSEGKRKEEGMRKKKERNRVKWKEERKKDKQIEYE